MDGNMFQVEIIMCSFSYVLIISWNAIWYFHHNSATYLKYNSMPKHRNEEISWGKGNL